MVDCILSVHEMVEMTNAGQSPVEVLRFREDRHGREVIRDVSQEQQIELMTRHGDVLVLMGQDVVKNAADGPDISRRFTNVWRAFGGSWRLVARQATIVGES